MISSPRSVSGIPVLVDGYAESLNFLASYLRGGPLRRFLPSAVMSSAQVLPRAGEAIDRRRPEHSCFRQVRQPRVLRIAYQCEASDDHHVMDESYLVEVLVEGRPAKPGEVGEVVITDLNNYSVPLIRYRVGDLAQAVTRASRAHVDGVCRASAGSRAHPGDRSPADGTWMPGTFFRSLLKDFDYIVRPFQIHQAEKGPSPWWIVRGRNGPKRGDGDAADPLGFIGDTAVTVEHVDEIPLQHRQALTGRVRCQGRLQGL